VGEEATISVEDCGLVTSGSGSDQQQRCQQCDEQPPPLRHLVWGKRIRGVSTLVLSRKINAASAMIATALGSKDSQKSTHLKEYHWYKYLQIGKGVAMAGTTEMRAPRRVVAVRSIDLHPPPCGSGDAPQASSLQVDPICRVRR